MGRLVTVALTLAVLGYMAYWAIYRQAPGSLEDKVNSAPKQQLENVRAKAKEIERNDQQRADDALKKTEGQ